MSRRALVAMGAGGVLAATLLWFVLPSTGPEPAPPTPPPVPAVPVPPIPVPPPAAAPRPSPRPVPVPDRAPARPPLQPDAFPIRVKPRPEVDPDQVHDPELNGIAEALFTRQPRLASCYRSHVDTFGPVHGRPTLRVTVVPTDDGTGEVEIEIENEGDGVVELDACLAEAMSDAQFTAPDVPTTVMQPLPLPGGL